MSKSKKNRHLNKLQSSHPTPLQATATASPGSPVPPTQPPTDPEDRVAIERALDSAEELLVSAGSPQPTPAGSAPGAGLLARLKSATERVVQLQREIEEDRKDLQRRLHKLGDLDKRERDIAERELKAEAGLHAGHAAALGALETQAQGIRDRLELEEKEYLARLEGSLKNRQATVSTWEAALEVDRKVFEAQCSAERIKMEEDRTQFATERAELAARTHVVAEQEHRIDRLVALTVEARIVDMQTELDGARSALDGYRAQLAVAAAHIRQRDDQLVALGGQSAAEMAQRNHTLEAQVGEMSVLLASRPSPQVLVELDFLRGQATSWGQERSELLMKLTSSEAELAGLREAAWDAETRRREVAILEQQRDVLDARIAQLSKTVAEYLQAADGATPFKGCSAMDVDTTLQRKPRTSKFVSKDGHEPLARLTHFVRHSLAATHATPAPLYYSEEDIRSFVAGMAMSRLLLLQGISGIGKTSLPCAVARALGGHVSVIPVQAGWRDRNDLLGHYNTFEGRYRESEFLRALYEAQTPQYADTIYFIVLDEMNLSRPEQYFADVLSVMENPGQVLVLTDLPVQDPPQHFVNACSIRLPSNVWFIGTANHDETTVEFANKTVDRSHVLELPASPTRFVPEDVQQLNAPIGVPWLLDVFEEQIPRFEDMLANLHDVLFEHLRDELADRFGIGLSGRLAKQLRSYASVVLAAGGTGGEALDYIFATRLLGRIRDRHDLRETDIQEFRNIVNEAWTLLGRQPKPRRTHALLEHEIMRLRSYAKSMANS